VQALRQAQDKHLGKTTLERLEVIRGNLDELLTRANEPTAQELQDLKFAQLEKLTK
jgi:hypothetical protein